MSFSRLGPFPSTVGPSLMQGDPLASSFVPHSALMENNIALTSNTNLDALPTSPLLQSNIRTSNLPTTIERIIFIRMQADLKMAGGDQLFGFLNSRYKEKLFFRYFDGYSPVLEIKFLLEPVCILVTTYQTRSWARRFAANQKKQNNFRMFMVCGSEMEMRQVLDWMLPNIVPVFANGWVDILNREVAIEYQNYGHDYIMGTCKNRKDTKYFYRYNNNQVLNIYYSSKLEPMLNNVGKQFLKNPRFKNTRLKSFTTFEQLLVKFNDRRKVRKSTISRMSNISSIGGARRDTTKIEQKLMVDSQTQKEKNLILIDTAHPQYQQIRVMVQDDKKDRWEMVVFGSGNDWQRYGPSMPVQEQNMLLMPEFEREQIVAAEELIVIIFMDDVDTAAEFDRLQNINFHSNLLRFDTPETLETIMRQLADNPKDFGLLILYEDRYEDFKDIIGKYIYQNSDNPVNNIKILMKARELVGGISITSFPGQRGSASYLNLNSRSQIGVTRNEASYFISPEDILGEENPNILQEIFTYRNLYYDPAKGLMGRKVELLINKNREYIINLCESMCTHNRRRLTIQTWNDFQHLNYLVRRMRSKDNAIVITNPEQLPFVMRQVGGIYGVHVIIITDVKLPKVPAIVLKQGTPREIQQFLMMIQPPIEDANWTSEKTYTDLRVNESSNGGINIQRSLQRIGFEDQLVVPNQIINKKKIVVRIHDDLDSENVALLETKLFNHYGDEIAFKYNANKEQIRDMDKWEEPLQFVIIPDEREILGWMQMFAINEANQRFQVIVYTASPNLNHLSYLTQDPRFRRFKLISNSWSEIEQYIIGRDSRSITMTLNPNQKLRLVLSHRDRAIQEQLMMDATMGNPIAQRCIFEYYDDTNPSTLAAAMQQIPMVTNEPVIVIVNQSRQTAVNEQVAANILADRSTFVKVLVIYPNTASRLYSYPRTASVVVNELEAVRWIQNIKFMGSISLLAPPTILVSRNNQYWKNYFNRIAQRRNLNYREYVDEGELRMLIDQILSTPNQTVWVLLDSTDQYQYYRKTGLSLNKNVGYIVQSPTFKNVVQVEDLIFGSNDREEIEMFLLNYKKHSTFLLSPSHLRPNNKVTLIANRSILIDQRQMARWSQLPWAAVKFYDQESTLRKLLDQDRQSNIFVLYTYSQDLAFGEAISKYQNVKRVVYNPEFKPRPYFQHESVAFVGSTNEQINDFLSTLRYLLRNPPYKIRNGYPYSTTNIFVPPNYIQPSFFKSLIDDNESIQIFFYNSQEELANKYNLVHHNCNNVILGNNMVENLVRSQQLFGDAKFINFSRFSNQIGGNTILCTDEQDQIILYLRNIPMTKYNSLLSINGMTGIYYDSNSFRRISAQLDQLPTYNPGINVYKYSDIRQIEKNLMDSRENFIFILVEAEGDIESRLTYLQSIISKIPNKKIQLLILSDDSNIRLTQHRTIISKENMLMRYLNHIPMITQENYLHTQRLQSAPLVTQTNVTDDVVLVFKKREPAGIIQQSYVKVDSPPAMSVTQSSRAARSWIQPNALSKFTILKSVNPAIGLNLVQEVVNIVSEQIRVSQPSISRVEQLRTIAKPAYQIIYKNRAASLLLQEEAFMQRSPRVEIAAGAIVRDEPMKILNKPLIPTVRRVTVTHTPSPPKVVVVPHQVVSTVTTKVVTHRAHPCKVALFFSDTPESQRHADYIIRNTDEDRSLVAIPFNNIAEVSDRLQRDYNLFDEIIIILDPRHSNWVNIADQITQRFRRTRWFIIDESDPDSLTKISLVFNLGWSWRELEYPYKNQNFALEQFNNIRLILPQGFYKDYAKTIGPGAQVYSSPHEIVEILQRNTSHNTLNIVAIPYSMLSLVYKLPFKYQNLRYVVIDDLDSGISERLQFDSYGDMFWAYAHRNPQQLQHYLGSLLNRRTLMNDSMGRNILFYQVSQENIAFSLSFIGYFKSAYVDQRDLEDKIQMLKPNETPFILRLVNGIWVAERQNKAIKKVSKINIPRAGGASKVMARPKHRPWILPNGEFIEDTDEEGKRKKILLVKMFNIDIFSKFNDFRFYYLTQSQNSITPGRDIHARTGDMIFSEAAANPQAFFLIFLEKGEERQLNRDLMMNPRINLIRISEEHFENQLHVRADECQPVVQRVKNIQRNSQIRYVLYRGNSSNSELKLQQLLMQERNIEQVEYNSMRDFESEIGRLQGKYRQIDVIVFDEELMEARRILDMFKINPYKLISIRRDARDKDRDSERNSENQLKIDSRLGARPTEMLERKNSLALLEAVQNLGNLQNIVLLLDANSKERDRISGILGKQLASKITLFNSEPIMRSLTQQFISKPVLILSDRPGISDFAEGRNAVLFVECNPQSSSTGYRNTFVLRNWPDLEGLARVLRQYVPGDYPVSNEIAELKVGNSRISQEGYTRSNADAIADRLTPDLNGHPIAIYLPRDRMMNWKADLITRENIMILAYTDQPEIEKYLRRYQKSLSLILLPPGAAQLAQDLQAYPLTRIITEPGDYQGMDYIQIHSSSQLDELMDKLSRRNEEKDRQRIEMDLHRLSRAESDPVGYSMTLTLRNQKQRISIFITQKNQSVRGKVEQMNASHVLFQTYKGLKDLERKLKPLGDNIGIVIENDNEIQDIERLVSSLSYLKIYLIRHYSNPLLASRDSIPSHDKVINTAISNTEIAKNINSLIYRSFKNFDKMRESKSRRLNDQSNNSSSRNRSKPQITTFGTTGRFDNDQHRSYSRQNSNKILTRVISPGGTRLL